jgi:hypothetical protein
MFLRADLKKKKEKKKENSLCTVNMLHQTSNYFNQVKEI